MALHQISAQERNSIKVWIFLATASVFLMVTGQHIGDRFGLLGGFLLAVLLNSLVFFYSDHRLQNLFLARELEGQDAWGLLQLLTELSQKSGQPMPRLFLVDSKTPFSFSTGLSQKSASIFVSQGLIERLPSDEYKAVLAYELIRIKRLDTIAGAAASTIAVGLVRSGQILDGIFFLRFFRTQKIQNWGPFAWIGSTLASVFIHLLVYRQDYLAADLEAADLCENKQALARVLCKLQSYALSMPLRVSIAEAHLFMINPLTKTFRARYFQMQPKVEQRVTALVGHFPL